MAITTTKQTIMANLVTTLNFYVIAFPDTVIKNLTITDATLSQPVLWPSNTSPSYTINLANNKVTVEFNVVQAYTSTDGIKLISPPISSGELDVSATLCSIATVSDISVIDGFKITSTADTSAGTITFKVTGFGINYPQCPSTQLDVVTNVTES